MVVFTNCDNCHSKTENFKLRSVEKHGDAYDYSKVIYKSTETKVIITCKKAGHTFEQTPQSHLRGIGCSTCSFIAKTKTTEQFIIEAIAVHGDAYDYSNVSYKNSNKKITITCKKAGHTFEQTPNSHLGRGCPKCSFVTRTKTTEQFIMDANEIHGDAYDYSKVSYKNSRIKITISCKKSDHTFEQTPHDHLSGRGCTVCNTMRETRSTEDFILKSNKIHNNKYNYDKIEYKNCETKLTITCNRCSKDFLQTSSSHLQGNGCPTCAKSASISRGETLWLDSLGIKIRNKYIKLSTGQKIRPDGYDPITNTIYEYNGDFVHGNPLFYKPDDMNPKYKKTFGELYQTTIARQQAIIADGYKLITIWESEFYS